MNGFVVWPKTADTAGAQEDLAHCLDKRGGAPQGWMAECLTPSTSDQARRVILFEGIDANPGAKS